MAVFASEEAVLSAGVLSEVAEVPVAAPAGVPEVLSVVVFAGVVVVDGVGELTALEALPAPAAAALLSTVDAVAAGGSFVVGTSVRGCVGCSDVGCARSFTGVIISAPTPV